MKAFMIAVAVVALALVGCAADTEEPSRESTEEVVVPGESDGLQLNACIPSGSSQRCTSNSQCCSRRCVLNVFLAYKTCQ